MADSLPTSTGKSWPSSSGPGPVRHNGQEECSNGQEERSLDYLELMDIEALVAAQDMKLNFTTDGHHLGSASPPDICILGRGLNYSVTRVSSRGIFGNTYPGDRRLDTSKKFVVVKKPLIEKKDVSGGDDFRRRLYAVMLELRILHHKSIREHPNIVRMLEFMWDTQNHMTKIAPSLILEYADLGTLRDFQDPEKLALRAATKIHVCLNIAKGLSFLHKCGIIHGDVKSENVLLFRESSANNSGGLAMCAKLSDFGCSLVEAFSDCDGKKQDLPGGTIPWDAPEEKKALSGLNLRRTDIYSYGLLVWRIVCNGNEPFDDLPWDDDLELAKAVPTEEEGRILTKRERFVRLKSKRNWVKRLARDSLLNRHHGDVRVESIDAVMNVALEMDPSRRANDMDEIVILLSGGETVSSGNVPEVAPAPLMKGEFGINSPSFPVKIHWLRNSPPAFRSIILEQLARNSILASTTSKRHFTYLALAVCYEQGLYAEFEGEIVTRADDAKVRLKSVEALLDSAHLGNPLAQSLVLGICRAHGLSSRASAVSKADWLVASTRHGSLRARHELKAFSAGLFEETIASITLNRRLVASALTSESFDPVDSKFLEQFPDLDAAARTMLTQPGIIRIHQAAFLGSLEVLGNLIMRRRELSVRAPGGETPLHYAALGGQNASTKLLIDAKFDVNAQSHDGATSLHFALVSLHPESVVALLLRHGADPNILSRTSLESLPARCDYFLPADGSPLHFAVLSENMAVAKSLLDAGAKPNLKSERGLTALESAVQIHSLPLLNMLLQYGTSELADLPNPHNMYAFLAGQYLTTMAKTLMWTEKPAVFIEAAVKSFRDHGIELDYRGILAAAFDANNGDIADYLLRKLGGNLKQIGMPFRCRKFYHDETTAVVDVPLLSDAPLLLDMIITANRPEIIKSVLQYVMRPLGSRSDPNGLSFLCRLASRPMTTPEDMEEIAAALVNHGATLAAATERNTGPLHCAAIFNNYHALDALLKLNPSISDVRDAMLVCMQRGNSWTSSRMLCSMWRQFPGTLYHPVRQQNDITSKEFPIFESFLNSDNPLSSLCMTWEHGRDDILHGILLSDMIQSLKLSSEGPKALHQLLKQENNQIMMYTPLHYAASSGNVTAVRLLIEEGADVNYSGRPNLDSLVSIGGFDMSSLGLDNDIADIITAASRGMTPLDVALTRNWHMSIYAWPKWDRSIIQMIRNAGGSHAEERRYNKRTGDIIKLLRDEGAKTKAELFSIPEPVVTANKTQKDETLRRFEFRENSTTDSESVSKIMQLFQASIELPSAQITMAKFPNLATNNDPDRPKLSSLFINVDSMFQKFVDTDDWCGRNVQQFEHMRSTYRLFILWATRNEVANGEIDGIQNISPPSQSVQLAASVFICLWDILHTLQMLEELTSREWKPKDYSYRAEEYLTDLDKAIAAITMEPLSLVELSEMVNAALTEQLNAPSIFDHLLAASGTES